MSLNQKRILIIAMLVGGMFVGIAGALAETYWLVVVGGGSDGGEFDLLPDQMGLSPLRLAFGSF